LDFKKGPSFGVGGGEPEERRRIGNGGTMYKPPGGRGRANCVFYRGRTKWPQALSTKCGGQ